MLLNTFPIRQSGFVSPFGRHRPGRSPKGTSADGHSSTHPTTQQSYELCKGYSYCHPEY